MSKQENVKTKTKSFFFSLIFNKYPVIVPPPAITTSRVLKYLLSGTRRKIKNHIYDCTFNSRKQTYKKMNYLAHSGSSEQVVI